MLQSHTLQTLMCLEIQWKCSLWLSRSEVEQDSAFLPGKGSWASFSSRWQILLPWRIGKEHYLCTKYYIRILNRLNFFSTQDNLKLNRPLFSIFLKCKVEYKLVTTNNEFKIPKEFEGVDQLVLLITEGFEAKSRETKPTSWPT